MARLHDFDEEGIADIERAAELNPEITASVSETIYQFLLDQGRVQDAMLFRQKRDEFSDVVSDIFEKRLSISRDERYEPAALTQKEIEEIREVLARKKGIEAAYLVKRVSVDSPVTMYDLAIFPPRLRIVIDGNALTESVEDDIQGVGRVINVFFGPWLRAEVRDRIKSVPGSGIYLRE